MPKDEKLAGREEAWKKGEERLARWQGEDSAPVAKGITGGEEEIIDKN